MIRKILQIGNPLLEKKSEDIKFPLSNEDKKLISDLIDTAKSVGDTGAGMSAVQIGILKKVSVNRRVDIEEKLFKMQKDMRFNGYSKKEIVKYTKELLKNESVKIEKREGENFNKKLITEIIKKLDAKFWLLTINPKIIYENEYETHYWEGCLSVGRGKDALFAPVARSEKITFSYQDLDGNKIEMKTSNYFAHVILHEIDHMEGVLFISKVRNLENIWRSEDLDKYIKEHKKYPAIK